MMSSKKETKKAYGRYEEPKERVNMALTQTAIQALVQLQRCRGWAARNWWSGGRGG
jgi:hypothetical protein